MTLLTSYRDVTAAFKAKCLKLLFQSLNLEILRNLLTEKCVIKAVEKTDTFGCWLCDSVLIAVLLNATGTIHQRPFRFKDPSVTEENATVVDMSSKLVGGAFSLNISIHGILTIHRHDCS